MENYRLFLLGPGVAALSWLELGLGLEFEFVFGSDLIDRARCTFSQRIFGVVRPTLVFINPVAERRDSVGVGVAVGVVSV